MSNQKRGAAASGILRVFQGYRDDTEREEVAQRRRQFTTYEGGGGQVYYFEPKKAKPAA